jgi:DNA-binding phage protein
MRRLTLNLSLFIFLITSPIKEKKTIALFLKNIFRTKNEAYIRGLAILGKDRHKKINLQGMSVQDKLNWEKGT